MSDKKIKKCRTRSHIIASQSANYVERFLIAEGHTAERVENDYGYDLVMTTYDESGYIETGNVFIQLKASDKLPDDSKGEYFYKMFIEDYNLWRHEPMPVYLILYDAIKRKGFWLYIQKYFETDGARQPRKNAASVRLKIPKSNRLNRQAIRRMRLLKLKVLEQLDGVISHNV